MTAGQRRQRDPAEEVARQFQIVADACPQTMLRILGLVAQLSRIPLKITCERRRDAMYAEIVIDELAPHRAEILLAKISAIITVQEARMINQEADR